MSGGKFQDKNEGHERAFADQYSQQPWCVYALHIATFTSLSFVFDPLIIFLSFKATASMSPDHRMTAIIAQLVFMFISKVVKLIGLFMREPKDIGFLPVSILFGYFHGWIKLYALLTLRMVSYLRPRTLPR
jgi:hypothetical protein